ncbi:hypothetical protein OPT61_g2501 [Boeremia exigua]|uniref:Uncharacterized protein n=1 Tax=Boeremia exigua TaxID=749465 RepID=A0ACC2IL98_9PLEO|nr:hypothetical protein OPT61_g2501 [Boeremia exigua]
MRLDPNRDRDSFPKRAQLPIVAGTPEGSAWFWGGSDELDRLNLLTSRGVLLDVFNWAQTYDSFTDHHITASDLKSCAESQGAAFQTGDILLIRTGWLERYNGLTLEQKQERSTWDIMQHRYAGLEASGDMKNFLHNSYFAAAATDSASLEIWSPTNSEASLHATLLPLWGMPVGELWDLEALSLRCRQERRWTFC